MSELQTLTAQRDSLIAKIREIEASCEGIENEHNAQRMQELNLEHAQLSAQKRELAGKLSALEARLSAISSEIAQLSGTGIDRILEAIKNQRWYFFKNKTKILMDRNTGLLWVNKQFFSFVKSDGTYFSESERSSVVSALNDDLYNWKIPSQSMIKYVLDTGFPYDLGDVHKIHDSCRAIHVMDQGYGYSMWVDRDYPSVGDHNDAALIPVSETLVENSYYSQNVSPGNPNYTEKERLQFTLDLFIQNDLWPIFDDKEITELYKKIYYEKPKLLEQLQELQIEIEKLQTVVLLSSEFDYTALLAKYDIKAIDNSVIKYYQAVQQWTKELMEKLDYYEKKKKM